MKARGEERFEKIYIIWRMYPTILADETKKNPTSKGGESTRAQIE